MSIIIPIIFIVLVFYASFKAKGNVEFIAPNKLNWFLVAFSAGTTANTGFIITSAIAMGYGSGLTAILFPLSFLLGDLFYWNFFAAKVNKFATKHKARTIPEFITSNLTGKLSLLRKLISLCIICSAILYTIAQWTAAGKIFNGFYEIETRTSILIFAAIVLAYCIIGGFLSSVYADIVQGTFMILLVIITVAFALQSTNNITDHFSRLFSTFESSFVFFSQNGVVFIFGWALAAIGFSFSQPHILDKVISAKDESHVKKARYVYIFFVQFTWIGMTLLGILIRASYNDFSSIDPERILAKYVSLNSNHLLAGFVISGVFATIASTASSLNISIANYINNDLLGEKKINQRILLVLVFSLTVFPAIVVANLTVFDLTIFAVALGATLTSCMLIKIFYLGHNKFSLISCIAISLVTTITFKILGWSNNILYDVPVGIALGLFVNFLTFKFR